MGIYPTGIIYGIKMYYVIDNKAVDLFEMKCDKEMNYQEKKEARFFYKILTDSEKQYLRFQIYTQCSSPYEDDFMMWYPVSLDIFKQNFHC